MKSPVRVRYAPSPTGEPHIGNIRTALFNWLYARHRGGKFILRIEDTDVSRKAEGATEALLEGLRWLGLDWDEGPEVGGDYGPYFQSQRLDRYQAAAAQLVGEEKAYYCFCSPDRLAEMRREQQRRQEPPGYDRRCRWLAAEERRIHESEGIVPVVRFAVPLEGQTRFDDLIRGEVVFENAVQDDFVLLKSDGYPTYHLANVVDDHAMEISHVMRSDEWVPSTPRHILLYQALGWEPPLFAHLPMVLGPDRSKLSKRHGATSLSAYREEGYLPEALVNFLALLGWSYDDKTELFSREELIRYFSLERIGKTAGIFNLEKLQWMNGVYIRQMSAGELAERALPILEATLPPAVSRPLDQAYLRAIIPLVQERLKLLAEITELTDFFFVPVLDYEEELLLGKGGTLSKERASQALQRVLTSIELLPSFDHESLEGAIRPLAEVLELKTGELFGVIRVAVTGRAAAPPLFETMAVLGRERCTERLRRAIEALLDSSLD